MPGGWWSFDPTERFWLEITDRVDLGGDLWTHQMNDSGGTSWSGRLVSEVIPGDLILHWSMAAAAITGWSQVAEPPYEDVDGDGRAIFIAPLAKYQALAQPVTLADLRSAETGIRRIREMLKQQVNGPLYFPFELSEKRPLRPFQGYLMKLPSFLLKVIPGLGQFRQMAVAGPEISLSPAKPRTTVSRLGAENYGHSVDSARRLVVEAHAVAMARECYERAGYAVEDVGATESWDLTATRGVIEVHIEVKGSTMPRDAVDLTDGEVRHAESRSGNVLVVVDSIAIEDDLKCSGGRVRVWPDWVPDRAALIPTAYRYKLPGGWNLADTATG